ncbi:MAG: hypothetical protein ACOCVF_00045 [bacterium]
MAKNIEVTDEMYEFLINLSREIKEQDNRATAMPYFFQVREIKEVAAHEGCGEERFYSSKYETELRTDDDKVEWIKENIDCFIGTMYEEEAKDVGVHTSTWDLDTMLTELDFNKFYVDTDYKYSNVFFTSKACDEHIRINKHNLKYPVNYLNHAYINEEMDMIFKFLLELTNNEVHE